MISVAIRFRRALIISFQLAVIVVANLIAFELRFDTGVPPWAAIILWQTLPWLVEDGFARMFGAVIGQRVADTGRRLLAFPEYAAQRMADSVASYARDEADLLARGDEMRPLVTEAATLTARVDALEARIEALARARESG